ncbi:MAG: hypothetical protein K2V38_03380, partial [Gemmataceae bacterium]|nr:hypothetical protein [Gemmataceae bacterium]
YLLFLTRERDLPGPAYLLTGQPRAPTGLPDDAGSLKVYPWNPQTEADLRKQVQALMPARP